MPQVAEKGVQVSERLEEIAENASRFEGVNRSV